MRSLFLIKKLNLALSLAMKTGLVFMLFFLASCGEKNNSESLVKENNNPNKPELINAILTNSEEEESTAPNDSSRTLLSIETVEDIKEEYAHLIDEKERSKLSTSSIEYNCNGEKSGRITYYTQDNDLRIIEHEHSEYSHHSGTDTYFIKKDKPFFVLLDRLSWSFDGSENGESQTKDAITEKRFYIVNEKIEKCLEKKFDVYSAKENNPTSDEVSNQLVQCPPLETVLVNYAQLQKYAGATGSIKCLQE